MKKNTPISALLTTNCTIVEAAADIQTVRKIFDHFPNQFLPVVEGFHFVGVILRDEFLRRYLTNQDNSLSARELISKEMVKLGLQNTLAEAKEIFDTKVFDVIPVTDEEDDLVGILLRETIERSYAQIEGDKSSILKNGLSRVMTFLSL